MIKLSRPYLLISCLLVLTNIVWGQNEVWQSAKNGALNEAIWNSTSSKGISSTCNVSDTRTLHINHNVSADCEELELFGFSQLIVANGAKLRLLGDIDAYGDTKIHIEEGGELLIIGDLKLSGNASLLIDGLTSVYGDIVVRGKAQACGTGRALAFGAVTGESWCYDIQTIPSNGVSLRASYDLRRKTSQVTWRVDTNLKSGSMVLERSINGMSFHPIHTYNLAEFESNQLQGYKDEEATDGVVYYRISRSLDDGSIRMSEIAAVRMHQEEYGSCDLQVDPNPCVPSCYATLTECPEGIYEAYIMDGAGMVVTELMRLDEEHEIKYHINKENFLSPGVYIISASNASLNKSKKVIIK